AVHPLSLHDDLPIFPRGPTSTPTVTPAGYACGSSRRSSPSCRGLPTIRRASALHGPRRSGRSLPEESRVLTQAFVVHTSVRGNRSEEHTSELQSQSK